MPSSSAGPTPGYARSWRPGAWWTGCPPSPAQCSRSEIYGTTTATRLDEQIRRYAEDKGFEVEIFYSNHQGAAIDRLYEAHRLPPVEHPVVRTHPATGRKNLYIGRHASRIVGEDLEESRALLKQLCEDACQPPRIFTHRWEVGDLFIWDNRCALHRGHGWPADQARVMHRTTIAADDAVNEWRL